MITNINISGFKSFIDQDVPLANLTLLAGLNSSGKSSVIQAVRMYHLAYKGKTPFLEGHGGVNELRSKYINLKNDIRITLDVKNKKMKKFIYTFSLTDSSFKKPTYAPELMYVGADRLGPQPNLPTKQGDINSPHVGDKGEYVIDFISKLTEQQYVIPESLLHINSQSTVFSDVLEDWLSEITPGVKFSYKRNTKTDISHAEIDTYRPTNVGFGLSYTLPIIAAALGCVAKPLYAPDNNTWAQKWESSKTENGILLIVENPEAHLHPKGQTAMGKLLALCAQEGAQIIVETHSEHVMDGIRIAIKQGELKHNLVKFHYFKKDEEGKTTLLSPEIDENAKLNIWPEGFFDQTLKNRALLAKRS